MLLMDPIPSLSKVYSLLIQEETKRSIPNASIVKVDSTILAAKVSIIMSLMVPILLILVGRLRIDQFVRIVVRLVILWISATSYMVFHQGLSSRINLPWHTKYPQVQVQNLLFQCINLLPSHLSSVSSFWLCLVHPILFL